VRRRSIEVMGVTVDNPEVAETCRLSTMAVRTSAVVRVHLPLRSIPHRYDVIDVLLAPNCGRDVEAPKSATVITDL
jgi:hypothetical protein